MTRREEFAICEWIWKKISPFFPASQRMIGAWWLQPIYFFALCIPRIKICSNVWSKLPKRLRKGRDGSCFLLPASQGEGPGGPPAHQDLSLHNPLIVELIVFLFEFFIVMGDSKAFIFVLSLQLDRVLDSIKFLKF
jgi:hypothetical protein